MSACFRHHHKVIAHWREKIDFVVNVEHCVISNTTTNLHRWSLRNDETPYYFILLKKKKLFLKTVHFAFSKGETRPFSAMFSRGHYPKEKPSRPEYFPYGRYYHKTLPPFIIINSGNVKVILINIYGYNNVQKQLARRKNPFPLEHFKWVHPTVSSESGDLHLVQDVSLDWCPSL